MCQVLWNDRNGLGGHSLAEQTLAGGPRQRLNYRRASVRAGRDWSPRSTAGSYHIHNMFSSHLAAFTLADSIQQPDGLFKSELWFLCLQSSTALIILRLKHKILTMACKGPHSVPTTSLTSCLHTAPLAGSSPATLASLGILQQSKCLLVGPLPLLFPLPDTVFSYSWGSVSHILNGTTSVRTFLTTLSKITLPSSLSS